MYVCYLSGSFMMVFPLRILGANVLPRLNGMLVHYSENA
jgi:hypothetical protein